MSEQVYCVEDDGNVADHERPGAGTEDTELVCQEHAETVGGGR